MVSFHFAAYALFLLPSAAEAFVSSTTPPTPTRYQSELGLVQRQQRPGDRNDGNPPRYSEFLYPSDPSDRKGENPGGVGGYSTALPVTRSTSSPMGSPMGSSMGSSAGFNPQQQSPQSMSSQSQQQNQPQQQQQQQQGEYDVYENEELSVDELRDQVERLLMEEEEAERVEREKLLKMRAQLLDRKRKRDGNV